MINALVPSLHPTSETLSTTRCTVNHRIKLFSFTFQRKTNQTSLIQPSVKAIKPVILPPDLKVASCGGVNLATSSSMGAAWSRINVWGKVPLEAIENQVNNRWGFFYKNCCFFQLRMKGKVKKLPIGWKIHILLISSFLLEHIHSLQSWCTMFCHGNAGTGTSCQEGDFGVLFLTTICSTLSFFHCSNCTTLGAKFCLLTANSPFP